MDLHEILKCAPFGSVRLFSSLCVMFPDRFELQSEASIKFIKSMSSYHRHYELAQSLPRAARGYWIPAAQPGAPERRPICLPTPSQGRPLCCCCWVQNLYLERPRWLPKELELPGVLQRPVVPGDRWGGALHKCLIHLWTSSTCQNCLCDYCLQIVQQLQRQCCWSNLL